MAYDIGPKIGIEGEKEFKNSIKAVESQLKALGKELQTLSKEYDENDRSVEGAAKKQKTLQSAVDATQTKIQLLTSQYEKQASQLKKLEEALEQARKENGEGSDQALKAEAAYARQATAVNNLGARLQTAKGELADFTGQLETAANRATLAGDTIQAAGNKLESVGGKVSSLGTALTAGVTAPLVAAGGVAVNMASDYEESLNKVEVAFGDASQGVKEFAQTTVDQFGIAEGTALDMAALYGDMATSMKIPREEAAQMSQELVGLAGDLASFKNIGLDEASTALKSIFTGETESLKNLGVVMTETNLQAFALSNGLLSSEKSARQLQEESIALREAQEQYNTAVEKYGESSWQAEKALLNLQDATEEANKVGEAQWDSLSESEKVMIRYQYVLAATKNAQGDYARTATGTANSLRTMQESSKELAVAFGQELLPQITPMIQKGTQLLKAFADLDEEQKQLIVTVATGAAAAGPAVKILGTATTGLGKLTKGVGSAVSDMGKLVQSGGKATDSMGTLGKVVGALATPGGKLALAATVIAGIGTAALVAREKMIKADMEGRFGEIALSAEEVENIAQRLTTTEWTMQVDTYIDTKEQLNQAYTTLKQAKSQLEKENWKISLGLDLSEENRGDYISAIESYIQSAIAAVEQASYTAQVAINTVFYPGSEAGQRVADYSQRFYTSAQTELQALGDELAQVVDKALGDSILTNEELLNINSLQSRMQAIMDQIADRQYQVELKKLEISVTGEGLTVESFQELMQAATEELQKRIDSMEGVTAEAVVTLEEMRDNKEITQATFEKWQKQLELYLAGNVGEMTIPTLELGLDTIKTNYQDILTETKNDFQASLDEAFRMIEVNPEEVNWFNKLWSEFDLNFGIMDGKAREGVARLLEELTPTKESLEAVRQQYVDAGKVPPASITEGLNDIYTLEQMSESADNTLWLLAQSIAESPGKQEAIAQSILAGQEMDEGLAQALRENYGMVWDASAGMFTTIQEASFLSQTEAVEFMNTAGISVGSALATSLVNEYGVVYNSATGMWEAVNAATAGTTAGANAQAKGQEIGAASGVGYVEGANSQRGNVEEASSGLVESGSQALSDEQPTLESQAKDTGEALGDSLALGIENTESSVDLSAVEVASSAADEMQKTLDGLMLNPPGMATPNWTTEAAEGRWGMQDYLNNHPLSVRVNQVAGSRVGVAAYATGGIVDRAQLAVVGEAGDEAIIPLENNRTRALDLWREAGERLNAFAASEGRAMGEARREQIIQNTTNQQSQQIVLEKGAVVIQTQATNGKQLYREFIREMQKDVKSKEASYGKSL